MLAERTVHHERAHEELRVPLDEEVLAEMERLEASVRLDRPRQRVRAIRPEVVRAQVEGGERGVVLQAVADDAPALLREDVARRVEAL